MKKFFIGLAGLTILIGVIMLTLFFTRKSKNSTKKTDYETTQITPLREEKKESAFTGTIKDIIAGNRSVQCDYINKDNSSTVWVKGKNVYGEFTSEGKKSYMIVKNNCMWIWVEGENQGMNMCRSEEEIKKDGDLFKGNEYLSDNDSLNCRPSMVNDSLFNVPESVTFMDLSGMLKMQNK